MSNQLLICDRGNCDNIMCGRYSEKYGYICDDCFEELIHYKGTIKNFMNSNIPDDIHENDDSWFGECDYEFSRR